MLNQPYHTMLKRVGLPLVFAILLAACGSATTDTTPAPPTPSSVNGSVSRATAVPAAPTTVGAAGSPDVSNGNAITDQLSLIAALRTAGATVELGKIVEQPYLTNSGTIMQVNGQDMQIFEYSDEQATDADAKNMADAINGTGTTMVTWIASPHAYRAGRVLALYVGDDAATLRLLDNSMGAPFAAKELQATITTVPTLPQTNGVSQTVSWQNLSIPLPPNAVWQTSSGANATINGAAVVERGAVTYPDITGVEQPYGPTFLVLQFTGTLDEWLDREHTNDASTAGNLIDEATIRDQMIGGLPAKVYRRSVTGTALTEFYALRLDDTQLLWITTDDAQNPLYQSVIEGLRVQTQ